ncbi:pirin family protein [Cohnella nanjingensis]|uniref:Pirin family protein n=1 Tax=Cohnella nanjingensis TaxID=1387779 RepID=A0A7X0RP25_9BACL|nr:pirin family protein [Cohnella nanjingensis]MBB6671082.1 pirin family protein [Cohnella nanjingensis]
MKIETYSPERQGTGFFDGGKITEQKPIGFPREGGAVTRVGPLFYWAWFRAEAPAAIGLHPHQGFEIVTYVLSGEVFHGDTLGTRSTVSAGGAQAMRTGSGVQHEEAMQGEGTEGFQIWFEPHLSQSIKTAPSYMQFEHEAFPVSREDGVEVKTVIGEGAPLRFTADAKMHDVRLAPGASYARPMPAGYALAALAIKGGGRWVHREQAYAFGERDFIVLQADAEDNAVVLQAGDDELRMAIVEIPIQVNYPLYRK